MRVALLQIEECFNPRGSVCLSDRDEGHSSGVKYELTEQGFKPGEPVVVISQDDFDNLVTSSPSISMLLNANS